MNDTKLRQSIQRWENEGGALLPPDCNVHIWRYSTSKSAECAGEQCDPGARNPEIGAVRSNRAPGHR